MRKPKSVHQVGNGCKKPAMRELLEIKVCKNILQMCEGSQDWHILGSVFHFIPLLDGCPDLKIQLPLHWQRKGTPQCSFWSFVTACKRCWVNPRALISSPSQLAHTWTGFSVFCTRFLATIDSKIWHLAKWKATVEPWWFSLGISNRGAQISARPNLCLQNFLPFCFRFYKTSSCALA